MNSLLIVLNHIIILLRYKVFILGTTFVLCCLMLYWAYTVDFVYRAKAVVNPPSTSEGGLAMMAAKSSGGELGSLLGDFMGSGANVTDCISILNSSKFAHAMIEKFNMAKRYGFVDEDGKPKMKHHYADIEKAFRENMGHDLTDEDAIVILIEDTSAVEAKEMVDYMIHLLDTSYLSLQKENIRENFKYINQLVEDEENKLKTIEDTLISFQKENNFYVPEVQIEASLREIGELEAQIAMLSEKLIVTEKLKGRESGMYKKLALEKRALKKLLRSKFVQGKESNSLTPGLGVLPAVATEFFRLERQYKIRLKVYGFLVKQVEALKVEFGKNIQQITVVDPPWVNTKKVAPARAPVLKMTFVLTILITSFLSLLHFKFKEHRNNESPHYLAWREIKRNIFRIRNN